MHPDVEGYTRIKDPLTGRTRYLKGGSGNMLGDSLAFPFLLLQLDPRGARVMAMLLLGVFSPLVLGTLGSHTSLGSKGAVIGGVAGLVGGLWVGYVFGRIFVKLLGSFLILLMVGFVGYLAISFGIHVWNADNPNYPSIQSLESSALGDFPDCAKINTSNGEKGVFSNNETRFNAYLCKHPAFLEKEAAVRSQFRSLATLPKDKRIAAGEPLKNSRRAMLITCGESAACFAEDYRVLASLLRDYQNGR